MFICGLCRRNSKPGERMFKAPEKASNLPPGPQITKEIRLCPSCAKEYLDACKAEAPDVNPRSAYAALLS